MSLQSTSFFIHSLQFVSVRGSFFCDFCASLRLFLYSSVCSGFL
jgi:hypothetical protein